MHRHIEDWHLNFAPLGSSAQELKAAGVNLLADRALHRTMHPPTPGELGNNFDLETALDTGTVPPVWVAGERRQALESYVRFYLREEVRAEGLVRNLPGFARFLPIAALHDGQVVNIPGIARDCGIACTTVQGYLVILEDTLLAIRLPVFRPGALRGGQAKRGTAETGNLTGYGPRLGFGRSLVYLMHMGRTNVDIDDEACAEVMRRYQLSTIREAVNFALRMVAAEPLGPDEARGLRGSGWEGDLNEMRSGRAK